jgi:hypothetical protein
VAWWDEQDGTVQSEFSDPGDKMLAMDSLVAASNRVEFEAQAAKLAARTPITAVWDEADISISPGDYLRILQRAKIPAA